VYFCQFTRMNAAEIKTNVSKNCMKNKAETDHRPWGYYTVLADEEDHKVKRIVVYPGQRLSLQKHQQRAEHWFVLSGEGIVTLDGERLHKKSGESVEIPRGSVHRIENQGTADLSFIEVQTGEYFGEDDIERMEDDYGRN